MQISKIPVGDNPPESLNVIIEVPTGGEPVKYEFDKDSGALFVDRILHTPMRYPCNYGFIPQTLCDDGDPLDCLVMTRWTLMPGTVVALLAEEGTTLEKGAPILTLEVMKMEQTLRAPFAGVLKKLKCKVGDIVQERAELAEVEPTPA